MKQSDFVRWLKQQGVMVEPGKKHLKLFRGEYRSHMPNHLNQELATGTMHAIKKQLGLTGKEDSEPQSEDTAP